MDLTPTEEQDELRAVARGFLAREAPADGLRVTLDAPGGWRPDIWPRLAALGWLGISLPEHRGGAGLGLVEETVILEEAGAALVPAPLHSTVGLALPILSRGAADTLMGAVVDGSTIVTFGWAETEGRAALVHASETTVVATAGSAGQWRLEGVKRWVPDIERADVVIVPAAYADGIGLFAVQTRDDGARVTARPTFNPVHPLGDVELRAAPARLLVEADDAPEVLTDTRRRALVLAAAAAVGITQRMLDVTAHYVSNRQQFGRVIATYQGVSHQVADMYVGLELARSLVLWAALLVDGGDKDAPVAVAAAAAKALPVAVAACETAIQLHGGVGTTWESSLHRYFKHALALSALDGSPATHRAAILSNLVREIQPASLKNRNEFLTDVTGIR